jgi:serine O-acetyltransferase
VGANSVVTHEVPPGATVVGIPARITSRSRPQPATAALPEFAPYGLPGGDCADPIAKTLEALRHEVTALRARVEELEGQAPVTREAEHARSR